MSRAIRFSISAALSFFLILGYCHYARAADYIVDPSRSELAVRLFKAGIASGFAHDHVIRATEYSGEASIDPEKPSGSAISVEVKADSLKADEPAMREKYGLTKKVTDKDRAKIQATMESPEQMDIEKYPAMKFHSTSIEKQSDGQYMITGDLTIHGVTQPVSFPSTVSQENGGFRGKASLRFKQSDFGIRPYGFLFGAVRNQDEAVLYLDILVRPAAIP